jgi:hypothetical protein
MPPLRLQGASPTGANYSFEGGQATFSTDELSLPEIDKVDRQVIESLARPRRY